MKKVAVMLMILAALFSMAGCGADDVPDYNIYSSSNFYDDDLNTGYGYRVVVDPGLGEKDLWAIYNDICEKDGGNLHRVWFFSSEEMARSPYIYDIAAIEQKTPGADGVYTLPEDDKVK